MSAPINAGLKTGMLVASLIVVAVLASLAKRSDVYLLTLYCVYLMATFGLNLTVGYAGQMSLGQAAFFGIGAYIAALALKAGVPFLLVLPMSAVACFVVGLALGFPALRVQHHYLAFATLGFNVLVYLIMRNEEKVTGGTFGISGIPRPSLLGVSFDGPLAFFFFTFVSLIILAFGSACAGIGGVYYASLVEFIEPGPFHFSTSLMMLLAVIVGGSGRFFGPVIGTVIIILLPELLRSTNVSWLKFMQTWYLAVFGVAVVALMIWLPGGI